MRIDVLLLSRLASPSTIKEVREVNPHFGDYAVQKFNRLIAEGLARCGNNVTAFSTFYQHSHGFFWRHRKVLERGVKYSYIPSPVNGTLRHIWIVFYCFFKVLSWGVFRKKKVLICDVLNISACIGAVSAARLIGLRRVGIMTDMPGLIVERTQNRLSSKRKMLNMKVNIGLLKGFSHYVFLTEQMNEVVNVEHKPYIIMEGLVDFDMSFCEDVEKEKKRIVIYAGGLHERYGLKMLVEAFIQANVEDSELWLYGEGPFVKQLANYNSKHVIYKGILSNEEVIEAEMRATLLVNPRPTNEEFTKYSFPSKNMEYMVSGTPVLTTMLPGMPPEYYPYVYLFDKGETVDGYAEVIKKVLSLPTDELISKGRAAREWVLDKKNNLVQVERITSLLMQ